MLYKPGYRTNLVFECKNAGYRCWRESPAQRIRSPRLRPEERGFRRITGNPQITSFVDNRQKDVRLPHSAFDGRGQGTQWDPVCSSSSGQAAATTPASPSGCWGFPGCRRESSPARALKASKAAFILYKCNSTHGRVDGVRSRDRLPIRDALHRGCIGKLSLVFVCDSGRQRVLDRNDIGTLVRSGDPRAGCEGHSRRAARQARGLLEDSGGGKERLQWGI